jgi:hypothetical protein
MPRGNRMGPDGLGPMTGRAAGYCAGNAVPGFMNRFAGQAMGMGFRRGYGRGLQGRAGFGFRMQFAAGIPAAMSADPRSEIENLQAQAAQLENMLGEIRQKIHRIKKSADEE